MSRQVTLVIATCGDESDDLVEDLEVAAVHKEGIALNVAGHVYHVEVAKVEAEPWTQPVPTRWERG